MTGADGLIDRSQRDWYRDAVIYELHVRAFADSNGDGIGDFRGLASKLDYLRDLGVTALWLLPFYPSPLRDDGYDIADYRSVHPQYGTLRDFRAVLKAAHDRGLRVITELVLNHTSDQHPWFQRARTAKPGSRWRNWYVWSDTPDRYREARIIFQDFESSNWTWDPVAQAYFWHRFYSQQPDLNFENSEVQEEMLRVVEFWLDMGVDGLRLDAVPYLYEAEGTNCENLPATHEYLKRLRAELDGRYPDRMLLAEANQWPEDAAAYFGDGDECHMNFHFPLMPRLFMSVQMEDRFPVIDILQQTPALPEGCQWAVFLRNHDELTLEMVTDEERDYMYRVYARDRTARINLGIRRRLAPLLEYDRRQIELLNGLLLSMPGTPVIYYGDEIGMGDNVYLGDRNGVRTPMQWSADRNAGFSGANPQQLYLPPIIDPSRHYEAVNVETQAANPSSLLWWMRRILALRSRHPVFGRGDIEFLHPDNHKVLAYLRRHEDAVVLVVANLSRYAQWVELDLSDFRGATPVELFGQTSFPPLDEHPLRIILDPHAFHWLLLQQPAEPAEQPATVPTISVKGRTWASVFETGTRAAIAAAVARYLPPRRWFAGKARSMAGTRIVDVVALPVRDLDAAAWVTVEVAYASGEPERYAMVLGVTTEAAGVDDDPIVANLDRRGTSATLIDATSGASTARALLDLLARRRRPSGATSLQGVVTAAWPERADLEGAEITPVRVEQSNSSILVGDRAMLKVFRQINDGRNPDHEIGDHLVRVRFPHVATLLGAVELRSGTPEPSTAALLNVLVPNEGDAWAHATDELGRYYERKLDTPPAGRPAALTVDDLVQRAVAWTPHDETQAFALPTRVIAERLGALHAALADDRGDPAFIPEPFTRLYQRALYQSLRNRAQRSLQLLERAHRHLDEPTRALARTVLDAKAELLHRLRAAADHPLGGQRIRIHGDLHLGQILWTGRDAVFIDFEGEPSRPIAERRLKRSPLWDVAGMLRSFDYAAHVALATLGERGLPIEAPEPAASLLSLRRNWYAEIAVAFLGTYLAATAELAVVAHDATTVTTALQAFLLDKALYEVGYELGSRPHWVRVPLLGIVEQLGIDGP